MDIFELAKAAIRGPQTMRDHVVLALAAARVAQKTIAGHEWTTADVLLEGAAAHLDAALKGDE